MAKQDQNTILKLKNYMLLDKNTLFLNNKNELICRVCEIQINTYKKSFVTQHLLTKMHKKNYSENYNKISQTQLPFEKKTVIDIIADGFLGANIPLYKIRFKSIKDMFMNFNITPPSETSIRSKVDIKYEIFIQKIKTIMKDCRFFLQVDESQINNKKYVNILIGDINIPKNIYLIESKEIISSVNSQTITICIDDIIKEFELKRENFYLILSDSARYMMKSVRNLKILYPNLMHVTCFAHALHNCVFKIKKNYKNVDFLIASMKGMVHKNINRKQLFQEIGPIPCPIVTRWGTWLNAVHFYSKNLNEIKNIVESIHDEGVLVGNAKKSISIETTSDEITFISINYNSLSDLIERCLNEFITIEDTIKITDELKFNDDKLEIKNYLENKINQTDILNINKMPNIYIRNLLLKCPSTTIQIERSFSILGKILEKERNFAYGNAKKYMVLYYNKNLYE